uniref:Progestin and adipoQ receptor family member IVb n=1 Tax=Petromyzon marinus TaxID=7757 RepID=S4RDX5_PETMA
AGPMPRPRLLDWASCPPHLRFNKFVLAGYRPVSTGSDCLHSLFYLHNESGNIYSHGLPLLWFLLVLPPSLPWGRLHTPWLAAAHCLACACPPLGSVFYHLFMNHTGGPAVYRRLLCLDMCGICAITSLGALSIIYCSFLCRPVLQTLGMLGYSVLSLIALHRAVSASTNNARLRAFGWQAAFRMACYTCRWAGLATTSLGALRHYVLMDLVAMAGGAINVSRVPERWLPGRFDYWFNSHQIMHVMVVLSILHLHWGVVPDLLRASDMPCPS